MRWKRSKCDEKLPLLVSAIWGTVNITTGFTTNMLMLGRVVKTPLQQVARPKLGKKQYVQELKEDIEAAHEKGNKETKNTLGNKGKQSRIWGR